MYAELKSHVLKFWHPGPKGAKWRWKGWGFFVTGTMNPHFFVTGQIGMKLEQKRQSLYFIEP